MEESQLLAAKVRLVADGSGTKPKLDYSRPRKREIDNVMDEIRKRHVLLEHKKQLLNLVKSSNITETERSRAFSQLEYLDQLLIEIAPHVAEDSTNLYIGNLSTAATEPGLREIFGKYGPIASMKIMYPRSPEELKRGRYCGFVSFLHKSDANQAKEALDGTDVAGMPMRICWGKAVPVNRDLSFSDREAEEAHFTADDDYSSSMEVDEHEETAHETRQCKIKPPTDISVRLTIDLVAYYVAENGYSYEAFLVKKAREDSDLKFLINRNSDNYRYFRWKAISIAQGDSLRNWKSSSFSLTPNGQIIVPPQKPHIDNSLEISLNTIWPESSLLVDSQLTSSGNKSLPPGDLLDLQWIAKNLDRSRPSVSKAMVLCIQKPDCSAHIAHLLFESMIQACPSGKVAHLYLISDILSNTFSVNAAAWPYRLAFERRLPAIFNHFAAINCPHFKSRVAAVLSYWQNSNIYTTEFLDGLEATLEAGRIDISEFVSPSYKPIESVDSEKDGHSLNKIWLHPLLEVVPHWARKNYMIYLNLRDDILGLEKLAHSMGIPIELDPHRDPDDLIRRLFSRLVYIHQREIGAANLHKITKKEVNTNGYKHNGIDQEINSQDDKLRSRGVITNLGSTIALANLLQPEKTPKPICTMTANIATFMAKLRQNEPPERAGPNLQTVEKPTSTKDQETNDDDDDDMFGIGTTLPAKPKTNFTPEEQSRIEKLRKVESAVLDFAKQLRGRNVPEAEVLLRSDAKRVNLMEILRREIFND